MRKRYSRLARTEERQSIRRAIFFTFLTIVSIFAFIFLGLPVLAKFAGFLTDLKKSGLPIERNDTTPPAPPRLENLPEYTNEFSVEVKGTTEAGASIILFLNNDEEELVVNKDGEFNFTFKLDKGENTVSVKARDAAGNESQETDTYKIIFDNEPPELEITSPEDGKEFYGSKERQVSINGKTEESASVIVNDRIVAVDASGNFTFVTTLSEGENGFTIKTEDKAGNSTEASLTLRFTP
jgi:hypothetical protein